VSLRGLLPRDAPAQASSALAGPGAELWNLRDGSRVVLESPATQVEKKRESRGELTFELRAGAAEFDVAPRPERTFTVHAGVLAIRVLGTRFRVERRDSASRVSVERGVVRVSWPGGARTLTAGEHGTFPPRAPVASAPREDAAQRSGNVVSAAVAEGPSGVAEGAAAATPAERASSRSNAPGEREATEALGAEGLFALADRARAESKLVEAVAHLKAITSRHPNDPRAPLAAFTRGRLLLESLGRPGEAAPAFAQARALAARGSALFEDALAREVEAHRASGNAALARERAELYRRLFPNGLRLRQVLRSGGVEDAP
jgi:transmembrane sensor